MTTSRARCWAPDETVRDELTDHTAGGKARGRGTRSAPYCLWRPHRCSPTTNDAAILQGSPVRIVQSRKTEWIRSARPRVAPEAAESPTKAARAPASANCTGPPALEYEL